MSANFELLFDEAFETALKEDFEQVQSPASLEISSSYEQAMQRLHEMNERSSQEALGMSIQSVLHNHRNRIHLFMDSYKCHDFIRELSDEIVRRAHKYKEVSDSSSNETEML
jgi:hypothetical protein